MKSYQLRRMNESDLKWVLRTRNHRSVRSVSSSSKRISYGDHHRWFHNSVSTIKLVFTENGKSKGVVCYDKETTNWSFYLKPSRRNRSGLGRLMLSLFLVYAKEKGLKVIRATVHFKNQRSLDLHFQFGFNRSYLGHYVFDPLSGTKVHHLIKEL